MSETADARADRLIAELSASSKRSLLDQMVRTDIWTFAHMSFLTLGIRLVPGWSIDALIAYAHSVLTGETKMAIVNVPPRSLKSVIFSTILPAYALALDPTCKVICCTYGEKLSTPLGEDTLKIMKSDWYQRLFPKTRLLRTAALEIRTTAGGYRLGTSVGGAVTGRGADLIILDDPIKADDAESDTVRTSTTNWVRSTLMSRFNNPATGRMVVVAQRLHEDDVCGALMETGGWNVLSLPAIANEDEVIDLGQMGVHRRKRGDVLNPAYTRQEDYDDLRRNLGSRRFLAQYQQQPIPADGAMFKRGWLRHQPARARPYRNVVQSWDMASKDGEGNDYCVCVTAEEISRRLYILDVYRERLTFPRLMTEVTRLAREYRPYKLLIEDASAGAQALQMLNYDLPRGVPAPIAVSPIANKVQRAMIAAAWMEAGTIILPDDAPWLADFESEILAFPSGRYDDQVDALAHLVNSMEAASYAPEADPNAGTNVAKVRGLERAMQRGDGFQNGDYDPACDPDVSHDADFGGGYGDYDRLV